MPRVCGARRQNRAPRQLLHRGNRTPGRGADAASAVPAQPACRPRHDAPGDRRPGGRAARWSRAPRCPRVRGRGFLQELARVGPNTALAQAARAIQVGLLASADCRSEIPQPQAVSGRPRGRAAIPRERGRRCVPQPPVAPAPRVPCGPESRRGDPGGALTPARPSAQAVNEHVLSSRGSLRAACGRGRKMPRSPGRTLDGRSARDGGGDDRDDGAFSVSFRPVARDDARRARRRAGWRQGGPGRVAGLLTEDPPSRMLWRGWP